MLWMIKTEVLDVYHDGLGCSAQKVYKGGVVRKHVSPRVDWESGKTEYQERQSIENQCSANSS